MSNLDRRSFNRTMLGSLLTFSLLETLHACDAFGAAVKPVAVKWLNEVNQLGFDLKDQKLKQTEWQTQVEELFGKVDLPELLTLIDFDELTRNIRLVDNGARSLRFGFQQVEGVPDNLSFGRQIFALKKDRSVVPHGHNNMATAFLILKGNFHGQHWDRLETEAEHYLIKPTIDERFGPGQHSSISDIKDNVHWFKALDEPAFIFNIHVMDISPDTGAPTGRLYLDPHGEKLEGGVIRAKKLNHEQAHKLYG